MDSTVRVWRTPCWCDGSKLYISYFFYNRYYKQHEKTMNDNVIFYQATLLEAKLLRAIKACGECGAIKAAICQQCADAETYGSCHDYEDISLFRMDTFATPKYHRAMKSLVKAGIVKCINRRNSIYKIADADFEAML